MRSLVLLILSVLLCDIATSATVQRPTQEQSPPVIRKAGGVLQGSATRKVEPSYPPLAKAARVSGAVVVELTIDEEGNVIAARAISGHPLLKDGAVAAAKGWKFTPTLLDGVPVKVIGTITFNFNLDDNPNEIDALVKEVQQNPNSADAHYRLGSAYCAVAQYEEAIEELKEAIRIKPDFSQAHCKLGDAYQDLHRSKEASDAYEEAIRLNSEYTEAIIGSGMVAALNYRYEFALARFKRAIELEPASATARLCMAITYSAMGRDDDSIASFKEALAIRPSDPRIHYELARIYVRAGRKQSAMEEYAILKQLDPQLAEKLLKEIER